jgi:ribosomal protein L32
VGLCMNPACRTLVRDGSETCPRCQSVVRPAALCRACGQDFAKVRFDEEDPTRTTANEDYSSDEMTGFITPRIHVEQTEDDDEDGDNRDEGGKKKRTGARRFQTAARTREMFDLCPVCGKHRPSHMTERDARRWEDDHVKRCNGHAITYALGYEFTADSLTLPIASGLIQDRGIDAFCRTLGTAFVLGAAEFLELEPDEIAFFCHPERESNNNERNWLTRHGIWSDVLWN